MEILNLYRMPWTMADNAMTWLEPTRKCNITCDACFARNDPGSEKSVERIGREIDALLGLRRCDAMLIAGGEPLTHPAILDIVAMVKKRRVKPVLITNGVGLTPERALELKRAGLFGFTFHVDSHQSRPGWTGKTEGELNELRQSLADMVDDAGRMICGFNMTVFPDTLAEVPVVVAWALGNARKVQSYTLAALRLIGPDFPFEFFAGGQPVSLETTAYYGSGTSLDLTAMDILSAVRKVIPDFEFCAFLGGTALPHSLKWALGSRILSGTEGFGQLGPKAMELIQAGHHFFKGRYMAFGSPRMNSRAKLLFLMGAFDPSLHRALRTFLRKAFRRPVLFWRHAYIQSICVVQPPDFLPSGERDNCDGCPNKTLWGERLVSACLLEEYAAFGAPITAVPKRSGETDG
jgi:hypothetical protein